MKKFIIGLGVLFIFLIYSLGIRHQQPKVSQPAQLTNNNKPTSTSKPKTSSSSGSPKPSSSTNTAQYKDGSYTGSVANAYYGNVQVAANIASGKISDVKILQYPNSHQTSVYINQQAIPYLQQEVIKAQNSHVNIITGATFTSQAFIQSLANALSKANA